MVVMDPVASPKATFRDAFTPGPGPQVPQPVEPMMQWFAVSKWIGVMSVPLHGPNVAEAFRKPMSMSVIPLFIAEPD
jgi:hypothetical protein